ncbi:MAG: hypothetical protein Q8K64_11180 [Sediminibacterium sp.]|nr:hypothetical protein [Sediminibacterium sp.]
MSKRFYFIICIFLISCISIVFCISVRIAKKENTLFEYKKIISSSTIFKDTFFASAKPQKVILSKPIYIVLVSINCEFCHEVMNLIYEDYFILKNNQLILIYLNSITDVKEYLLIQKISKKDGIYIYSDNDREIRKLIEKANTPSVFLFENNSLSLKANGLTQSFNLIKSLK